MLKKIFVCFVLFCALLAPILATADAAKKTGAPLPEDFAFKGLALGDSAEAIAEKLGEPDFDTTILLLDQNVKCYVYSAELKVCTDPRTDKVVAIFCKDKKYTARDGVTYGSTRAKLMQTYGEAEKYKHDGVIYYVYRNPDEAKQKLMLEMETTNYYVESFLITSLPITEEEEAEYEMGELQLPASEDEKIDEGNFQAISGGFNSKGEWWTVYNVSPSFSIGIGS